MKLINLSVSKRLTGGFGVLLLFTLLAGAIGLYGMNLLYQKVNEIVVINNAKSDAAGAMQDALTAHEIAVLNLLLATSDEDKAAAKKDIAWQFSQYEDARNSVAELFGLSKVDEAETNIFKKIEEDATAVAPLFTKMMDLADNFRIADALRVLNVEVKPLLRNWKADVTELGVVERRLNDEGVAEAERVHVLARNLSLGVIALALLLGVLISTVITRSITRPLREATNAAQMVASGDLTNRIEVKSSDETGRLMQALKEMNENLVRIVNDVRSSTDSITTASKEISQGNSDLSQRTEQQASSLEETASSMEELTSTVRQNTENAKHANQLAASASEIAVKGGKVVNDVVDTMDSISTSSKKIVDIISVIESIAFQTNILALNAAVEAARAGEQGRGFAVVASEVRNLAQRSAAAAKEIKVLIDDSVSKVDLGAKQVDEAGTTMKDIVQAVKRVTDIMAEISAASNEQSAGIEEVNQAIVQMDGATQQNAALVEEAAAAAESMQGQAEVLEQAVRIFKLEGGGEMLHITATKPVAIKQAAVKRIPEGRAKVTRKLANKSGNDSGEEWKEF